MPWADAFDPAANLRALGEIQQRGLQAAGDLVDRMVKAVDGDENGDSPREGPRGASGTSDVDRLFEVWSDLFRRSVQAMVQPFAAGAVPNFTSTDAAISVDGGVTAGAAIRLVAGAQSTTSELFLHNPTLHDVHGLHVHCSGLWAHDGTALAGGVVFAPHDVDVLHARSSRGVTVSTMSNGTAAPGAYRGIVLVTGVPDAWLPIEVVVEG